MANIVEKPLVLIIDDELAIRRLCHTTLEAGGYRVSEAANGNEGVVGAASWRPDIILLDLNLPDIHGLEVLQRLREWFNKSIIILSVVCAETTIVQALDLGADDYLTKPFGAAELLARIRVCLRHQQRDVMSPIFTSGHLHVNLALREVMVNEVRVKLTVTEYDVLSLLVKHAGKVITHRFIINEIWGPRTVSGQLNNLRVVVLRLRQKIELDPDRPQLLLTEPGVGYRLEAVTL